jgi:hypothetical protein
MANINAPVCFLREIKIAISGDTVGDLYEPWIRAPFFPSSSASRRKMRAPVFISYFSRQVK